MLQFFTITFLCLISADNRKLLHEQEVEKMLIHLLQHDDVNVQVAASNGLGVMAENLISRESIGTWGEKNNKFVIFKEAIACILLSFK